MFLSLEKILNYRNWCVHCLENTQCRKLDENVEAMLCFLCLGRENNEQPAVPEIDDAHYVAATFQGKSVFDYSFALVGVLYCLAASL